MQEFVQAVRLPAGRPQNGGVQALRMVTLAAAALQMPPDRPSHRLAAFDPGTVQMCGIDEAGP